MKIKIYQIDKDVDKYGVIFADYDDTLDKAGQANPDIYRTVYEGDVECETLEEVFDLFNSFERPAYVGRSLSVSDVLEVCDEDASVPKGCYFCNVIGWRKIEGFNRFER